MEDVEVGGRLIRAGEGVMASLWAANHDGAQYGCPANVDLDRDNGQSHLAFGSGAHQCLGQSLARLEMRLGLSEVFRRFPSLRIADADGLSFRTDSTNYGLYHLPLTW